METLRFTLVNLCNFIFGIIGFVLAIRIVLKLMAANATIPVVGWAFNITDGFIYPFRGILPNISLGGRAEVDLVAFIALLGYSVAFYVAAALVNTFIHAERTQIEKRVIHEQV